MIVVDAESMALPSVALHMYVPASEAASGLNVSVLVLPVVTTPDEIIIWLFTGPISQVMIG